MATGSDHQLPIPTRASKARIGTFAEQVAVDLQLKVGQPLEPLVSSLGGRIRYKEAPRLGQRLPESIIVYDEDDFVIYLPSMTSPVRDRFTIAHELGHLFLHFPKVREVDQTAQMAATRWVDDGDPDQVRAEWEANWFAASFLMPEEGFKKLYTKLTSVKLVAAHFAVSTQAAQIRVTSLGL